MKRVQYVYKNCECKAHNKEPHLVDIVEKNTHFCGRLLVVAAARKVGVAAAH